MSVEDFAAAVLVGLNKEGQNMVPNVANESNGNEMQEENAQQKKPASRPKGRNTKRAGPRFVVEPRTISVVKKTRCYMNHSYRDCSNVPPELNEVVPTEIAGMTFAQKVHHMLSNKEYKAHISWMPHGRSFKIHVPVSLERRGILSKYFGHSRFSTFLRQLNNHGFKHITRGTDRNTYYHECMLRGLPHLCKYMPEPRDARRLIPDPDNEPDFYAISKLYPLPDVEQELEEQKHEDAKKQPAFEPAQIDSGSRPAPELPWELEGAPARNRARREVPPAVAAASTVASVAQPIAAVDPAIMQVLGYPVGPPVADPRVTAAQSELLHEQAVLRAEASTARAEQQQFNTANPAAASAIAAYLRSVYGGESL